MSVENMGNGYVKVGVKQEDLEASIAGLRRLKPILQAQVTRGNGNNTRQAAIDRPTNRGHEIKNHFKGRMYKNQRGAGTHRQIY